MYTKKYHGAASRNKNDSIALAEQYLKIRCFSYPKFYTKEIANPVSKRHKLSKLVLFNHM